MALKPTFLPSGRVSKYSAGCLGKLGIAPGLASRPHIAHKTIRGTSNDADIFDIRIVGDYVYVNSQIVRLSLQPNGPHAMSQIRHAAGHHAYGHSDGDQQYQGWAL